MAEAALRAVLGLLAVYHLGMGALSALAPAHAGRLGSALYGVRAAETPQLRYGLRMLGLYALALGMLLAIAAVEPRAHRSVIAVAAALQAARAVARIVLRGELAAAFAVPAGRNALNAALLLAEAAVLAWGLALL